MKYFSCYRRVLLSFGKKGNKLFRAYGRITLVTNHGLQAALSHLYEHLVTNRTKLKQANVGIPK